MAGDPRGATQAARETKRRASIAASDLDFADFLRKRRRRTAAVYAGTIMLLFALVGTAAIVGRVESTDPQPGTATTPPPTPTTTTTVADEDIVRSAGFIPETRAEPGSTIVPLGFIDGTTADLSYPEAFDFLSNGIELHGVFDSAGTSRTFSLRFGTIEDQVAFQRGLHGGGELIQAYPDGRGGTAELWRFGDESNTDTLLVAFGPWTLETWDYRANRSESRDETLELWIQGLDGDISANGYATLSGRNSLELPTVMADLGPDGPDLRLGGADGDILLFLNQCGFVSDEQDPANGVFEWCDLPTQTRVVVFAEPYIRQRLHADLRITLLAGPSGELASGVQPHVAQGFCGEDNMPAGWRGDAVQIGNLWLWGIGPTGRDGDAADASSKVIALLEPGPDVTVTVPLGWRRQVSHLFDDTAWNAAGRYTVDQKYGSVTFSACEDDIAQFVGGFVFKPEARCAPLEINGPVTGVITVPLDGGTCDTGWIRHTDRDAEFTFSHPGDWYLAPDTLTPALGFPMLAAVSTFEAPAGGDKCAHIPTGAIEAVGPEDVLMTIHELPLGYADGPRPASFRATAEFWPGGDLLECIENGSSVRGGQFRYFDGGRTFEVIMAMGLDVSSADEDAAWAMLNSFVPVSFEPAAGLCALPQTVADRLIAHVPGAPDFPQGWVATRSTAPIFHDPDPDAMALAAGARCSSIWTHTDERGELYQLVALVGSTTSAGYVRTTAIVDDFVPNMLTYGFEGIGDLDLERHADGTLTGRYNGDEFMVIALDGWSLDYFIDVWDAGIP